MGTLQAFDVALEAGEGGVGAGVDFAEGTVFGHAGETLIAVFPKLGVGAGEPAHVPIRANENVDMEALLGSGWRVGFEILVGEGFQIGRVFTADNGGLRIKILRFPQISFADSKTLTANSAFQPHTRLLP